MTNAIKAEMQLLLKNGIYTSQQVLFFIQLQLILFGPGGSQGPRGRDSFTPETPGFNFGMGVDSLVCMEVFL
jgi:hypothetical protein